MEITLLCKKKECVVPESTETPLLKASGDGVLALGADVPAAGRSAVLLTSERSPLVRC